MDQGLAPGLIIKWDRSNVTNFNGLTACLSIDLDVLIEDCQVRDLDLLEINPKKSKNLCRAISEIARNMRIAAADVCSFYIPERIEKPDLPRCIDNLSPLFETLENAILRGKDLM